MAPYPTPNEYFKYAIRIRKRPNGTYFTLDSSSNSGPVYVYDDIKSGSTDNSAQLGDVSPDVFASFSPRTSAKSTTTTYIGRTADGSGFLGSYYNPKNKNSYLYLYTNKSYVAQKNVTIDKTQSFAICFAAGTLIRTVDGDAPIEALTVGDLVITTSGARRPIRWLGHRTVVCAAHEMPSQVWPVRILADAFGAGLPARDLHLSPGHPILVGADDDGAGGHLVPVMCLINGTTIDRVKVDSVTYWHVELDVHDILLAEGLPAESYLDWGDRAFFSEAEEHALMNPDFVVPGLGARCRPVAIDGPVVEAERRRLDAAFALRLATACAWPESDSLAV